VAEVPVVLKVVAGGAVSALRRVNQQAKNLSKRFRDVQKKTDGLSKKLNGLSGVLGRVALAEAGRRAVAAAADYQALQQRIALLTSDYGENAAALEIAASAAKTFGLSQREAAGGVADIYARLRPMGVSLEDIETTFRGFNTAAKLSGASAMEASGAFRQLSQALGSGRLQGDEFRSIAEQMPAIMTAIGREMDQPVGKLKKLASQGEITADIVIRSLERIEKEGAGKIASIMENSPVQKMKDLQNQVEELQISIGDNLIPVALPLTEMLTELLKAFNGLNPGIKAAVATMLSLAAAAIVLVPLIAAVTAASTALGITLAGVATLTGWGIVAAGVLGIGVAIHNAGKDARKAKEEFDKLLETGTSGQVKSKEEQLIKQLDELVKTPVKGNIFTKWRNRLDKESEIMDLRRQIMELKTKGLELKRNDEANVLPFNAVRGDQKKQAELKEKAEERATEHIRAQSEFLEAQVEGKEKEYLLEQEIQKLIKENNGEHEQAIRAAIEKRERLKEQVDAAKELKGVFQELGTEIKDSMVEGLKSAIKGTESLGEAVGNILNRISDKLLDLGLNMVFKGLNLPFMAKGGPVSRGRSYVVGEKGPEVFTPSRSGAIVPNNQIGGGGSTSIVVNVDASGSEVEGDEEDSRELGNMLAAAIQTELVRQQRPGGLLA